MKLFTVTAGHGDKDPGAVAMDGKTTEAALMSELRDNVADILIGKGHEVKTDGRGWENWPLVRALKLIPQADAAIELHMNASTNPAAQGVEVISLPAHKDLAREIARRIAHTLEIPVRGAGGWIDQSQSARGRLAFVNANGLIVEVCFISNPKELSKYQARKHLVAAAIAESLSPTEWK